MLTVEQSHEHTRPYVHNLNLVETLLDQKVQRHRNRNKKWQTGVHTTITSSIDDPRSLNRDSSLDIGDSNPSSFNLNFTHNTNSRTQSVNLTEQTSQTMQLNHEKAQQLQQKKLQQVKLQQRRYEGVINRENQTIQNIPLTLVPKEITNAFHTQRKNHVTRMLNQQLILSKNG